MITVIISEVDGWREWKHRARTKDAQTAIIRAMNKHFPRSYNFIPDDIDNAPVLFAAVTRTRQNLPNMLQKSTNSLYRKFRRFRRTTPIRYK